MFRIRKYIIITALTAFTFLAKAQSTGKRIFTINGTEGDEPKILTLYQNHQGYIFAGTTKGLYRFDGVDFYKYQQALPDSAAAITAIGEVYNNQLWLGFEDGHLAVLQNNSIEPLVFEEGYPKKTIKKILFDKAGTIWLATAGEGIY